ncbi:MAG: hypothetical protein QM811_23545 [Pirellulales bacterium]
MRRLAHVLVASAAALAGVVLVCVGVLWTRGLAQTDDLTWNAPERMTRFRTSGGGFWFETRSPGLTPRTDFVWNVYDDKSAYPFAASDTSPWYERWGFLASTTGYDLLWVMPYWSVILLCAIPLVAWNRLRCG